MKKITVLISLILLMQIVSLKGAALELETPEDLTKLYQQQKPVMILFYADWCGACKAMKEPYDTVADATSEVLMVKINVKNEKFKELKKELSVTSIPTIITRQSGALNEEQLKNMVAGHARKPQQTKKEPPPQSPKKS